MGRRSVQGALLDAPMDTLLDALLADLLNAMLDALLVDQPDAGVQQAALYQLFKTYMWQEKNAAWTTRQALSILFMTNDVCVIKGE